jgi:hypothetical protein
LQPRRTDTQYHRKTINELSEDTEKIRLKIGRISGIANVLVTRIAGDRKVLKE